MPNFALGRIYRIVLILSLLTRSSLAGEFPSNKFKTEYSPASARLRQAYSQARFQGQFNRPDPASGLVGVNFRTILVKGPLKKAICESFRFNKNHIKQPAFEFVYVLGKSATFELSRDFNKNDQYQVNKLNQVPVGRDVSPDDSVFRVFTTVAGIYASAPFASEVFDTVDLWDETKVRITSIQDLTLEGRHVVRVGFVANDSKRQRPSGEIDFLPDRCWAIQRCQAEAQAVAPQLGGSHTFLVKSLMTVEYDGDQAGIPILKRVNFDRNFTEKSTFDFDEVVLGAVASDSDFALRSYGLPDLTTPLADPSRNNATSWLLGMAAVTLVAAIVVWKRRSGR